MLCLCISECGGCTCALATRSKNHYMILENWINLEMNTLSNIKLKWKKHHGPTGVKQNETNTIRSWNNHPLTTHQPSTPFNSQSTSNLAIPWPNTGSQKTRVSVVNNTAKAIWKPTNVGWNDPSWPARGCHFLSGFWGKTTSITIYHSKNTEKMMSINFPAKCLKTCQANMIEMHWNANLGQQPILFP